MVGRRQASTPIGRRLRELREIQNLSQGDIEEKTGLLRCYISRVENGHTVPSLETLERFANGLGLPLFRIFYQEAEAAGQGRAEAGEKTGVEDRYILKRLRQLTPRLSRQDREVLLSLAKKLAGK